VDEQQQPTYDDLVTIINRDRAVKEMLVSRLASVTLENAELVALVRELQQQVPAPAPVVTDGD